MADSNNVPLDKVLLQYKVSFKDTLFDSGSQETESNGKALYSQNYENLESRYHQKPIEYSFMEEYYLDSNHAIYVFASTDGYLAKTDSFVLVNGQTTQVTILLQKQ